MKVEELIRQERGSRRLRDTESFERYVAQEVLVAEVEVYWRGRMRP